MLSEERLSVRMEAASAGAADDFTSVKPFGGRFATDWQCLNVRKYETDIILNLHIVEVCIIIIYAALQLTAYWREIVVWRSTQ